MASVKIFVCDICGVEKRWKGWEDQPGPVKVVIPGGSTQFKREFDEVCDPCGKSVRKAINDAIAALQPKEVEA